MKYLNVLALTIAIIGAVNWGLIGAFQWNLVETLFGTGTWFTRIIYILVGLSGLYLIVLYPNAVSYTHLCEEPQEKETSVSLTFTGDLLFEQGLYDWRCV